MPSDNECKIYIIKNTINDKIYIGQTWKTIEYRLKQHCYPSQKTYSHKLARAIKKYGKDKFYIELLVVVCDQTTADWMEKFWINTYDSIYNGYNIREGGSKGRLPHETRKKISIKLINNKNGVGNRANLGGKAPSGAFKKGNVPWNKGKKMTSIHPMFGKRHSEESRIKISKTKKGQGKGKYKLSKEQIDEMKKMYVSGMSLRAIGIKFNCDGVTVANHVKGKYSGGH